MKIEKFIAGSLSLFTLFQSNALAGNAYSISTTIGPISQIERPVQTILGVAQWIGFIVGVAMIIWVGVKYLTAGAGQKAEVKSTMIPILIGAFLVALAPTIANWLFTMFGS